MIASKIPSRKVDGCSSATYHSLLWLHNTQVTRYLSTQQCDIHRLKCNYLDIDSHQTVFDEMKIAAR